MAKLDPLIRVRKHTVEEKQKFLAILFRTQEELIEHKAKQYEALKREAELAEQTPEDIQMQQSYFSFRTLVKQEIEKIDDSIKKLEIRIEIAQDAMRDAYADFKKVEIVDRNRKNEQAKAELKKENDRLDEIGLQIFSRGSEES